MHFVDAEEWQTGVTAVEEVVEVPEGELEEETFAAGADRKVCMR